MALARAFGLGKAVGPFMPGRGARSLTHCVVRTGRTARNAAGLCLGCGYSGTLTSEAIAGEGTTSGQRFLLHQHERAGRRAFAGHCRMAVV